MNQKFLAHFLGVFVIFAIFSDAQAQGQPGDFVDTKKLLINKPSWPTEYVPLASFKPGSNRPYWRIPDSSPFPNSYFSKNVNKHNIIEPPKEELLASTVVECKKHVLTPLGVQLSDCENPENERVFPIVIELPLDASSSTEGHRPFVVIDESNVKTFLLERREIVCAEHQKTACGTSFSQCEDGMTRYCYKSKKGLS